MIRRVWLGKEVIEFGSGSTTTISDIGGEESSEGLTPLRSWVLHKSKCFYIPTLTHNLGEFQNGIAS